MAQLLWKDAWKSTRHRDLSLVTPEISTRGRQPLDLTGWGGSGYSGVQGSRAALTMTTSPGIGVSSLSRNRTFSSLTGTSNTRLSAEMVTSAGLLWDRALSTAASVCGQGQCAKAGYQR
jgi:hypothetical protein